MEASHAGIRSLQVRGFRSVANSGLDKCGPLNILIGKNNAGKSNVLGAIELVLLHLKEGKISGSWPVHRRPKAEFTDSDDAMPLRIGVEFDLSSEINNELRARLTKEAPHLERSIELIKSHDSVVFILAAGMDGNDGFLFVEQIAVGKLTSQGEDIAVEGTRLLSVTKPVGLELHRSLMSARMHLRDIEALNELFSERRLPFEYFTAAKGSQNDNASSVYAWQT